MAHATGADRRLDALQAGVRIWVAFGGGSMPTANVDEIGYLGAARMLAGYGRGSLDLSGNIVYRAGYAVLIAPCWLLSQNPATVYRLVQVEGAVIGAGLLPLAYLLARRCGLARSAAFLGGKTWPRSCRRQRSSAGTRSPIRCCRYWWRAGCSPAMPG